MVTLGLLAAGAAVVPAWPPPPEAVVAVVLDLLLELQAAAAVAATSSAATNVPVLIIRMGPGLLSLGSRQDSDVPRLLGVRDRRSDPPRPAGPHPSRRHQALGHAQSQLGRQGEGDHEEGPGHHFHVVVD